MFYNMTPFFRGGAAMKESGVGSKFRTNAEDMTVPIGIIAYGLMVGAIGAIGMICDALGLN